MDLETEIREVRLTNGVMVGGEVIKRARARDCPASHIGRWISPSENGGRYPQLAESAGNAYPRNWSFRATKSITWRVGHRPWTPVP